MKLKDNRGFTTADVSISIIIVILFTFIIAGAYYNYYISNANIGRNSRALNYAIDVIETVEQMNYNDISNESVQTKVQDMYNNGTISQPYQVTTQIVKYNETDGNTDKEDLIKILTVQVEYAMGDKTESFDISRLIINK